jgi:DNA invertase Pin-like site-specific DNA recombinase
MKIVRPHMMIRRGAKIDEVLSKWESRMPKRKIPKAEHAVILLMRKSGRSVQDIARMYGVTRQAIYKIIWASA